MKIKHIQHVILDEPKQFYDVIECSPYHNFEIKTNSSTIFSHNCSFEDEVNFSAMTNNVEKMKKKMISLISQIDARMKSRFMRGTQLPTLNIIASSKNSDQSFLDEYINTKKKFESKNTLVVDEPQWVVDSRKDTPEHFWVAIGNKFLANELLPLNCPKDLLDEYKAKGYTLLSVPMGYLENFQDNIDGALTDIAGISTASSLKYISGIRWNEIKSNTYENPFTMDIITVGTAKDDISQYYDFFDLTKVSPYLKSRPMYIHLDLSKSGDKTGIAGVYVIGKKPKVEGESASKEMFYQVAFNVSVKAPKGYEISFDKNRAFIRWLREQGFNIRGISFDTFQSSQLSQQLAADGFEVKTISVDRLDPESKTQLQYAYLKSTIYERRIMVYNKGSNLLTEEIIGLERLSDGHIEHPEQGTQGCFTGDTKISLVDGRELTLLELINEFNSGKQNYVYSFNEDTKKIEPKLIKKAWCTRKDAELVEVTLDNGEILRCTPNHKFMLRDGSYCEAQELKCDDSLMPLYRKYPTEVVSMKKYRMYYEPIEDKWHYEHRQFAKEVLDEKYLVHHKNCNPSDNSPDNLIWCSRIKHLKIHSGLPDVELQQLEHPETQIAINQAISKKHQAGKYSNAYTALNQCNQESQKLRELCPEVDKEKFYDIFGFDYDSIDSKFKAPWVTRYRKIICKDILNHKVISVKKLDYTEDVYDLTIADNHNFALSAGVFVHNSKDSIDSLCGALWDASLHADEFAYEFGESLEVMLDVSNGGYLPGDQKQLTVDFETELAKVVSGNIFNDDKDEDSFRMDFGYGKSQIWQPNGFIGNGIIII